jgi:hypothetical protein
VEALTREQRSADAVMDLGEDPPARKGLSAAEVEAVLLRGYPGLVRLAYLVLPPTLRRHQRILSAHAVVQRYLPDQDQLERSYGR